MYIFYRKLLDDSLSFRPNAPGERANFHYLPKTVSGRSHCTAGTLWDPATMCKSYLATLNSLHNAKKY